MRHYILLKIMLLTVSLSSCFSQDGNIHKSFNLNINGLDRIIIDQSDEIRNNIMDNPQRFLELADFMLSQPEELFYLADKKHAVTKDQAPGELVSPADYGISYTRADRQVSSLMIDSLVKLTQAAEELGLDIVFASGYRPFDYQEMIYNRYVDQMGQEEADRISARPGTSQHQLGTAVDFGSIDDSYALTEEGQWLKENAHIYGFSLSYPDGLEDVTGYKWECWHYRYITVEGMEMQNEFFSDIQQYLMEFWHYHQSELKEVWRK